MFLKDIHRIRAGGTVIENFPAAIRNRETVNHRLTAKRGVHNLANVLHQAIHGHIVRGRRCPPSRKPPQHIPIETLRNTRQRNQGRNRKHQSVSLTPLLFGAACSVENSCGIAPRALYEKRNPVRFCIFHTHPDPRAGRWGGGIWHLQRLVGNEILVIWVVAAKVIADDFSNSVRGILRQGIILALGFPSTRLTAQKNRHRVFNRFNFPEYIRFN